VVRAAVVTEFVSDGLNGPQTRIAHETSNSGFTVLSGGRLARSTDVGQAAYVGAYKPDVASEARILERGERGTSGVGEVREHVVERGLGVRYLALVHDSELAQACGLVDGVHVVEESCGIGLRFPGVGS